MSNNTNLQTRNLMQNLVSSSIHEGQLSFNYGFIPYTKIPNSFPVSHQIWDELSKKLPSILAIGQECKLLSEMPTLPADEQSLPNQFLSRASIILANFTHAFFLNNNVETPLPNSIQQPWQQVCSRLGRQDMWSTIFDAVLCNWKLKNENELKDINDIKLSDLELLAPMFGNQEERIFNLTLFLTELRFAPALEKILIAIEAVRDNQPNILQDTLTAIKEIIKSIKKELKNISPNSQDKNYVDPVVWAKTVARFGEPIQGREKGVGGAAFPLFHALDCFLERRIYGSDIGQQSISQRKQMPKQHQDFLSNLELDLQQYSLKKYIEKSDDYLKQLYHAVCNEYRDLLSQHRLKAYGYIDLSFSAGRTATNGGSTTARAIVEKLSAAANERIEKNLNASGNTTTSYNDNSNQKIYLSELVKHNKKNACWMIINNGIYDMTNLMDIHPGGQKIVLKYSGGVDATTVYNVIGHSHERLIKRKIGSLQEPVLTTKNQLIFDQLKSFLIAIVEIENNTHNNFNIEKTNLFNRILYDLFLSVYHSAYKTITHHLSLLIEKSFCPASLSLKIDTFPTVNNIIELSNKIENTIAEIKSYLIIGIAEFEQKKDDYNLEKIKKLTTDITQLFIDSFKNIEITIKKLFNNSFISQVVDTTFFAVRGNDYSLVNQHPSCQTTSFLSNQTKQEMK